MAQRILVVDDDRQILRLISSYLTQSGFTVLTADSGDTAMHALRREKPDLVVLDVMLPGRDGWEIVRWLRGDPTLTATPVLMLTASTLDPGASVEVALKLPDEPVPRRVTGRVVRIEQNQEDPHGLWPHRMAIEFALQFREDQRDRGRRTGGRRYQ